MKAKGQGSIEYLLLIGGIIVVATIVIAIFVNSINSGPAPECFVECGDLVFTEGDKEAECNAHAMKNPVICPGYCLWTESRCSFIMG